MINVFNGHSCLQLTAMDLGSCTIEQMLQCQHEVLAQSLEVSPANESKMQVWQHQRVR
jgi:hypothetical protein